MELSNWFKGFEKGIAKLTVEQRECAVTFKNNDYGKRKSKLPGGI